MISSKLIQTDIFKLFVLYFIANIFLLLNIDGIYWDDYVLYNHSYETLHNIFTQAFGHAGSLLANIHYTLLSIGNGIFTYRVLTFVLYFLTGYFIYKILETIKLFDSDDKFWIVLLYLIVPLYSARIALIDFPYTLFLSVFFCSFYLLSIFLEIKNEVLIKKILLRITIITLFFLSFLINSLLVYYAIVLFYLFYKHYLQSTKSLFKKVISFAYSYVDFILLPIVFYIIKIIYFAPTGDYENYNRINLDPITLYELLKNSIGSSLYDPAKYSFDVGIQHWYIILPLFLFLYFIKPYFQIRRNSLYKILFLFLLGSLLFGLAVFPYLAVNKVPSMMDWDSRHQLLIPFSFAIFTYIVYLTFNTVNRKMAQIYISFTATLFITTSIYNNYKYAVDSFYQISIQENMKNMKLVKDNTTFIVTMKIPFANERKIRFYELNGIMKQAFNNDSRLFVQDYNEINEYKKYKNLKQYNFSSWIESKPIYLSIRAKPVSTKYILNLFYYNLFNKIKFKRYTRELVTIHEL